MPARKFKNGDAVELDTDRVGSPYSSPVFQRWKSMTFGSWSEEKRKELREGADGALPRLPYVLPLEEDPYIRWVRGDYPSLGDAIEDLFGYEHSVGVVVGYLGMGRYIVENLQGKRFSFQSGQLKIAERKDDELWD